MCNMGTMSMRSTATLLSAETEKSKNSHYILFVQKHHLEHPDQMHRCVVGRLHYFLPQTLRALTESNWESCWCLSSLPSWYLQYHKTTRIVGDLNHPSHSLFSPLPLGRRLQSLRAKTSRPKNSFDSGPQTLPIYTLILGRHNPLYPHSSNSCSSALWLLLSLLLFIHPWFSAELRTLVESYYFGEEWFPVSDLVPVQPVVEDGQCYP